MDGPLLPEDAKTLATRILAEHFDVTGVDISDVQVDRARTLVPNTTFLRADIAEVDFLRRPTTRWCPSSR